MRLSPGWGWLRDGKLIFRTANRGPLNLSIKLAAGSTRLWGRGRGFLGSLCAQTWLWFLFPDYGYDYAYAYATYWCLRWQMRNWVAIASTNTNAIQVSATCNLQLGTCNCSCQCGWVIKFWDTRLGCVHPQLCRVSYGCRSQELNFQFFPNSESRTKTHKAIRVFNCFSEGA